MNVVSKINRWICKGDRPWKRFFLKQLAYLKLGIFFRVTLTKMLCPHWCLPWSPYVQQHWATSKKIIELELTEYCNLSCTNCECSFTHAPSGEHMSVEQIKKFVDESIELNWRWQEIKIRGGEPTLHPDIVQIIEVLKTYRNFNPMCRFSLLTNGFSDKTKEVISKMPEWIIIINSYKEATCAHPNHDSINLAPIDLRLYRSADFSKGCGRTTGCGMALSRYGYYPCCMGAHVARIFGFDIAIKKLSLVNETALKEQLKVICRYCGHYKQPGDRPAQNIVSESWASAFKKFRESKPKLPLY